jgi:hypothetical protein
MAIINNSNRNGRALEFTIVNDLIKNYSCSLINNSNPTQVKDQTHFNNLPLKLKTKFLKASNAITTWLDSNYSINNGFIDRIDDSKAVKGDVTDIRINKNINLSIKHNHKAVKHQRPAGLAQHLGFKKKSVIDVDYRKDLKIINNSFLKKANIINPNFTLYSELKNTNQEFINDNLYEPVCKLVANFISTNCCNSITNTQSLFDFIIGNTDFIKLIIKDSYIDILEFSNITKPKSLTVTLKNKSYIYLNFDNGWVISMRLHTASSRFADVSLKFDSQPHKISVKKSKLNF